MEFVTDCCTASPQGEIAQSADGTQWARCSRCKEMSNLTDVDRDDRPMYERLVDGKATMRRPDKFDAFMTGAVEARQNNKGDIRLIYEDGAEETASVPLLDITEPSLRWTTIVQYVQDYRGHGEEERL